MFLFVFSDEVRLQTDATKYLLLSRHESLPASFVTSAAARDADRRSGGRQTSAALFVKSPRGFCESGSFTIPLSRIRMTGFVRNVVKHAKVSLWRLAGRQGQIILCLFSKPSSRVPT